jgi:hypothetical protein
MKSKPSIQGLERDAPRLTIPHALIMKNHVPMSESRTKNTPHQSPMEGTAPAVFQSLERNKKKTMVKAPGFPYNPHK